MNGTYNVKANREGSKRNRKLILLFVICWSIGISGLVHIWNGSGVVSADSQPKQYVVQAGDTVWSIAQSQGHADVYTTVSQIEELNHLNQQATVYPGQVLEIPQ